MSERNACGQAHEMGEAAGQKYGQIHEHMDAHFNGHYHGHICLHDHLNEPGKDKSHIQEHGCQRGRHNRSRSDSVSAAVPYALTIRSHSGLSGDMLLCGLAVLNLGHMAPDSAEATQWLGELAASIMPELADCISLAHHKIGGINGWQARVELPCAHEHRSLGDIAEIIKKSRLAESAKKRAGLCFELLAACEAAAHGIDPADVYFHEVGALDSILDICAVCELYTRMGEPEVICGPLPVADGGIMCQHGLLPAPAPATLQLLKDIPVRPFTGDADAGELLTPTGIALLRALNARFGAWPAFTIKQTTLVYGQKEFANAPNGVIFAFGKLNACSLF